MNPAMEGSKTLDRVTLKRRRTLSRPNIWRRDFRYVRVPLILAAIGCSLSYWH
jgi:hypothetical protein